MAKDALLDLNTLIERPTIAIDGKKYEIRSPDELSIIESQQFTFWGAAIEELSQDEDKASELKDLIDKVAEAVLVGVPAGVLAKLSGVQKHQVIEVFTVLLLRRKIGAVGAAAQVMKDLAPLTGAKKSPASSATSAEPPRGGSKKHRQR